jgi:hypothetical protein
MSSETGADFGALDDMGATPGPSATGTVSVDDDLAAELADVLDDDAVADVLRDRPDRTLRPALRALTVPQLELFAEFVAGFEDRRAFLMWGVRALVHSLGELDPEWLASSLASRSDLAVLVDGYPAPDTGEELADETATRMRVGLAALDLLPAFADARARIRFEVKEWAPGEWDGGVPDGEQQRHPAMLPALTELEDRLVWATETLLDGFGSSAALAVWHQEVVEASFVELDDSLLTAAVVSEVSLQNVLVEPVADDVDVTEIRIGLVLDELLPAFARAVDARVEAAREHVEAQAEKDSHPGL